MKPPTAIKALTLIACSPLAIMPCVPARAEAVQLSFPALAAQCAPSINIRTLSSLVRQESGLNPYVININGDYKLKRQPQNAAEAVVTAQTLLNAGYNIDVGLGQINSNNFASIGLTLSQLFEPCANLGAAAKLLSACYQKAVDTEGKGQTALRAALSCYNTGSLKKGFKNGYVSAVVAQAALPVPELLPMADDGRNHGAVALKGARVLKPAKEATPDKPSDQPKSAPLGGDVFETNGDADAFAVTASGNGDNKNNQN